MLFVKQNQKLTLEYSFLTDFINSKYFDKYQNSDRYSYTLIQEPFTGIGYPDLVCVIWEKNLLSFWNPERNYLNKDDIKILHYLYITKERFNLEEISRRTFFPIKKVEKSILRLLASKVVKETKSKYSISSMKKVFFIKDIISIEAKLYDWRRALDQARYNCLFSSNSFVLFPPKTINENMLCAYENSDVGIISFEDNYRIVKKAERKRIPSTIHSWKFNEYIGRTEWNKNQSSLAMNF